MISDSINEDVLLGEVASFIRGINFKPKDVVPEGTDGAVACMRTKNVQKELDVSDVWFVDRSFVRRDEQLMQNGDILISSANSWNLVGKCCWIPDLPWTTSFGGFVSVLRADPKRVFPRYLYHWFASPRIQLTARSFGRQTTNISNLDMNRCKKLQLKLPPLDEQKRIAEVLDRAEALRARRRAALALLDELTQSIFLDMFGDPVTNPEGWPIRPIVELAENKDSMRVPIKQSDRDERSGKYPYYGSVGIIDDIDDFIYEGPHLLISEDGKHLETRNRPIACLADGQFWVNNHAHVLAANGNAELVFLAFNLEMRPLHQFVTGIDQFKLNRKSMDKIPVAVPPIELQQEFAQRIRAIEDQKSRFEAHLGELGSLFASLQSRAFKGELFGCSLEPVAAD